MKKCLLLSILLLSTTLGASLAHAGNWYAVAFDGDLSWGSTRDQASKAVAIKEAMNACRNVSGQNSSPKNGCRILGVGSDSGYLAIAVSPSRIHYAIGKDEEVAQQTALRGCVEETPETETCSIELSKYNGTPPKTNNVASNVQPSGNCRPRTATVRCSSQCYNGDCVVTYENGCKMRVQVGSHFNSFENRWDYDSPRC
jgi:hypothetical protein